MSERTNPDPIIGQADAFLAVLEQVSRLAPLSKPVLIVGERGTGKELIASRLHYLSARWTHTFVKFNCAALNEEMLESELFGHVAGAYTGAVKARTGRFELADGGTMFLDELPSMSLRLQEKLLRVVEYGQFERMGGSETLATDVRLIAAANADLPALARAGRFREDLLDRLAFDVVTLPPLRERRDDIPLLAQKFGENMARELGRPYFAGFGTAAMQQLQSHLWPGNVRELRNVVERAVYRHDDPDAEIESVQIDPFASPYRPRPLVVHDAAAPGGENAAAGETGRTASVAADAVSSAAATAAGDFKSRVAVFEQTLLTEALREARFNQRRAAEMLGLTYHQLRGLLRKYQMTEERAADSGEDGSA